MVRPSIPSNRCRTSRQRSALEGQLSVKQTPWHCVLYVGLACGANSRPQHVAVHNILTNTSLWPQALLATLDNTCPQRMGPCQPCLCFSCAAGRRMVLFSRGISPWLQDTGVGPGPRNSCKHAVCVRVPASTAKPLQKHKEVNTNSKLF